MKAETRLAVHKKASISYKLSAPVSKKKGSEAAMRSRPPCGFNQRKVALDNNGSLN
jgi:hypothetical protein